MPRHLSATAVGRNIEFLTDDDTDDDELLVPPVRVPAVAELTTSAEASVVLAQLRTTVRWVGAGRRLTKAGRLTLADARELSALLELDQRLVARARGADDLPGVALVVAWARAARLVRTVKGRLVPVKSSLPQLDNSLDVWERAFEAFDDLGSPITGRTGFASLFGDLFTETMPVVWLALYTAGGSPVPQEFVSEILREVLLGQGDPGDLDFDPDSPAGYAQQQLWRRNLDDALEALDHLGATRRELCSDPEERTKIVELAGRDDPDFTMVSLTGLGLWAVNRRLREEGATAPLVGELAGEDFAVVCPLLVLTPPETADAAVEAWLGVRDEASAVAELAGFVESCVEPTHRLFGLSALARTGDAGVMAAHQIRAHGGVAGAVAAVWLVDQESLDQSAIGEAEMLLGLVDQLAVLLEMGDLFDGLAVFPVDEQVDLVRRIASVDHPGRMKILSEIARDCPEPQVAQAARTRIGRGSRGSRGLRGGRPDSRRPRR